MFGRRAQGGATSIDVPKECSMASNRYKVSVQYERRVCHGPSTGRFNSWGDALERRINGPSGIPAVGPGVVLEYRHRVCWRASVVAEPVLFESR